MECDDEACFKIIYVNLPGGTEDNRSISFEMEGVLVPSYVLLH
jgi:hypothetical protein